MISQNRAPLAGMLTAVIVFLVWLALAPGAFWVDVAVSLAAGLVVAVVVAKVFPYDADLVGYTREAQRRVHALHRSLDRIDKAARRIIDPNARALVLAGTDASRRMIENVQDHEPSTVASSAALLQDKVTKLLNITEGYLRYQDNAHLAASRDRMAACTAGFGHFRVFAEARLQQALDGDLRTLNADLRGLEPIDTLTLSQGDTHA